MLPRSVAERVAVLEQTKASILQTIEDRKGPPAIAKAMAVAFTVGRAACSSAAVVDVCPNRLEYAYAHPAEGRIDMVMYYKDMIKAELDARPGQLLFRFRVQRTLQHFGGEYDFNDASHWVGVRLADREAAATLRSGLEGLGVKFEVVGG